MTGMLIAILALMAAVSLCALYLLLLPRLFPEQIRADEVFYLRTRDLWLLRICRYRKGGAPGEPVLLVHGMGANQNNFTQPENGCLVDYLRAKGYDCWTIDLRGCRSSAPPFERTRNDVRMEDFFMEDLPVLVQHILRTTGYANLHWIGHSMGGMLLYAFAQTHGGGQIASGVTLGSPIDFNDAAGKVPVWLIGFGALCPQLAGRIIRGIVPVMKGLHVAQVVFPINNRNLPETMNAGHFINMLEAPLPGLMRQVMHWLKNKEYKLLDGKLDVAAGLPDFPVPLLAFYAAQDPFIDPERALACFNSIKIEDKRSVLCSREAGFVEDYSHCDLAFSREAATEIFEPVAEWLEAHPCSRLLTYNTPENETAPEPEAALSKDSQPPKSAPSVIIGAEDAPTVLVREKPKTAPKPKAARKVAAKKKPAAAKKTSAAGKKAPAKKPAAKKKTAAKTAASKKAVKAGPADTSKSADSPVEGIEISPEALARAEAIRAARNQVFSEIESKLNDIGENPES